MITKAIEATHYNKKLKGKIIGTTRRDNLGEGDAGVFITKFLTWFDYDKRKMHGKSGWIHKINVFNYY